MKYKYVKSHDYKHHVTWDDGSTSYYNTKEKALAEIGRESGRRGLGVKKNKIVKNILGK